MDDAKKKKKKKKKTFVEGKEFKTARVLQKRTNLSTRLTLIASRFTAESLVALRNLAQETPRLGLFGRESRGAENSRGKNTISMRGASFTQNSTNFATVPVTMPRPATFATNLPEFRLNFSLP